MMCTYSPHFSGASLYKAKRYYFSDSIIRQYHANVKGGDIDKPLNIITTGPSEEPNNDELAFSVTQGLNSDAARCC